MRMALYQPDIAGNTGTIIRLCACFGVALDIIEPCGFPFSDKQLKRSAMDYASAAQVERRPNFSTFNQAMRSEEHTSELQSLMRISYAVFCLKKKKQHTTYYDSKTSYTNI